MITYENLAKSPSAFRSMTGFSVEAFASLFLAFARVHEDRLLTAPATRRHGTPRQRQVGAGRRFSHDLRTRLLMTLIWLRVYPTFELLGFLFSLNKTNVHATVNDVLATLLTMTDFAFERPPADRKKTRSPSAVMEAFPDVRLIIDAKEQAIHRPKSSKENDQQKPYYSGKKKRHTLKNEIGVLPDGEIGAVSGSVPGGAVHDLTLLRTTRLVEQLDPDEEGAMVDKGYVGAAKEFPNHRLVIPHKAKRGQPLTLEEKAWNRKVAKHRIVVEHTNAQLNQFQVLAQVYRHARAGHTATIRVVAMLINRRIRERPLKSYPAA